MSALLAAAELTRFAFLNSWATWAAALLAGYAATVELILLVSLPATIATGRAITRLSAGMTLIGYAIAFVLPLIGGWLTDSMEWAEMALIPLLIFTFAVLPALGKNSAIPEL